MILHMGIAGATKFDTFNLEEKEADALAASLANVLDQFDWTPDPRFTAVAGLVTTSATIYGPRLYLYREHLKMQRQQARPKPTENSAAVDMHNYPIDAFGGSQGFN